MDTTVASILGRVRGDSTRAGCLTAASLPSIFACTCARPGGATDVAVLSAMDNSVASILGRVQRVGARAGCLAVRAFISRVTGTRVRRDVRPSGGEVDVARVDVPFGRHISALFRSFVHAFTEGKTHAALVVRDVDGPVSDLLTLAQAQAVAEVAVTCFRGCVDGESERGHRRRR